MSGCPICGGFDREQISLGFFECTTVNLHPHIGPSGTTEVTPWPCGHRYQEGAPLGLDVLCRCRLAGIGRCATCDQPFCGKHHAAVAGLSYCQHCAPAARAAEREGEEAEWRALHDALPAASLKQLRELLGRHELNRCLQHRYDHLADDDIVATAVEVMTRDGVHPRAREATVQRWRDTPAPTFDPDFWPDISHDPKRIRALADMTQDRRAALAHVRGQEETAQAYRRAVERHNGQGLAKLFGALLCIGGAVGCFVGLHHVPNTPSNATTTAFLYMGGSALVLAALVFLGTLLAHSNSKPRNPTHHGPPRPLHD